MKHSNPGRIRAVLFDLDGTLVQVDMPRFVPAYVTKLGRHFLDRVPLPRFAEVTLRTVHALISDENGDGSNKERFLGAMENHLGLDSDLYTERLDTFCADGLNTLAPLVHSVAEVPEILDLCFENDLQVVIATNPVFFRPVVEARINWGKLSTYTFDHVTSLENSRFCKPSPRYFLNLADHLGVAPSECLMIGNDAGHDLAATQVGMPTFLVDTWLVERERNFMPDHRGNHEALLDFLRETITSGREIR